MDIGSRVTFVLAPDIEAIVIGKSESAAAGREYQVAWINEGERVVAWVTECEIRRTEA